MNKSRYLQTIISLIILFGLFLVAGNYYIYSSQKQLLLTEFRQSQQTLHNLLTQLARESLITENYALIEWYFKRWGEGHPAVIELTLTSSNGFALSQFQRPLRDQESEIITTSSTITLHQEDYLLSLRSSSSEAQAKLLRLVEQMLVVSAIAITLLAVAIWLLFQRLAIRPLLQEITSRQKAEEEIQHQHQFLQSVINGVIDGITVINSDYKIILINTAAKSTLNQGHPKKSEQLYCYEVTHNRNTPCAGEDHPCPLHQVLESGKHTTVIHNHPDANGNNRYFELLASPLLDNQGKVWGIIETSRELTTHIQLQKELEENREHLNHLAHHDPLTGLPNRLLFMDRLEQARLKANRTRQPLALLFIDLDQFKQINDSDGHNIGDQVLQVTARLLQQCIRADDTIARLGGDEFTIIIDSYLAIKDVSAVAEKILLLLNQPLQIAERQYHVTPSIGISLYPQDANNSEDLIKNADAAMFRVKDRGRNSFQFYTEDLTQKVIARMNLERGIRRALQQRHFVVWYQPQYEIVSRTIIGMEALVRWNEPGEGMISPAEFIPLCEESNLILDLGEYILNEVMAQ
ncbi:MAG: diguanylate cyclase, partial [Gammaproteobacteria bacterium]|nr:diguanylate cyclase [Gammaproteobacteria bacterium]